MSEADTPMNGPEQTDLTANDFAAASPHDPDAAEFAEPPDFAAELSEDDWQTVDFPNALSVDAIARPSADSIEDEPSMPTDASNLVPAESTVALSQAEIIEIVSLMQELQQRNSYLLSRVSQLEVVLNDCQTTLEAQAVRAQEQETILVQQAEELLAAEEHINRLMHELDCAHQAAQRQQILVETLTGQLESSQERVAQLERECALTQQRYNEQTHSLLQTENTCRDLRSRLHRQQRYTLQFKAALEKCLDISSPCHEAHQDLNFLGSKPQATTKHANEPGFLPKVESIKPWSAQPWLVDAESAEDAESQPAYANPLVSEADIAAEASEPLLELSPALTSLLQDVMASSTTLNPSLDEVEETAPETAIAPAGPPPSISYDLKKKDSHSASDDLQVEEDSFISPEAIADVEIITATPEITSAELVQRLDAVVSHITGSTLESQTTEPVIESHIEPEDLPEPTAAELAEPVFSTYELEIPPEMSDDPIWQDLAKLIDTTPAEPPSSDISPVASNAAQLETNENSFSVYPSWPSPVVYPLRSQKKRASLAAVELPTFPQRRS